MQERLAEAWGITMGGNTMEDMVSGKKKDMGMTLTELVLLMMHYRLLEEQGDLTQASAGYEWMLLHLERFVDEKDRVGLYPQIAYRRMKLLAAEGKTEEAVCLAKKGIALLQMRGRLFYLRQLLEFILEYDKDTPERKEKLREIIDSIVWVYEKYEVAEKEWVWNIPYGVANIELFGDVIRARRRVLGMSQEELSDGICDPVSISRIEQGKVAPKKQVYQKLLARVGMTGDRYESTIQVERPELFAEADKACTLMTLVHDEEAEQIVKELEGKMEDTDKFSMQYFQSLKALVLYSLQRITPQEHSRLQEEALFLTVPQVSLEKLAEWNFSLQEIRTINHLADSYDRDGRREEGIALLEILKRQYEKKPFPLASYVAGYEVTMLSLGDLLGNAGKYKEAIAASEEVIRMGLGAGRGAVASAALYDIGWDMEQLWDTGTYTKEESLLYVKASYALRRLFESEKSYDFIREHIQRLYEN
ncbi:MAG: helix-turn-helix transcriptional regulator, partial [Lachnospiraceae bacterium]|nr:helix-turn-helix transcriptional regulator [Lachnospiraceae bacterium]